MITTETGTPTGELCPRVQQAGRAAPGPSVPQSGPRTAARGRAGSPTAFFTFVLPVLPPLLPPFPPSFQAASQQMLGVPPVSTGGSARTKVIAKQQAVSLFFIKSCKGQIAGCGRDGDPEHRRACVVKGHLNGTLSNKHATLLSAFNRHAEVT